MGDRVADRVSEAVGGQPGHEQEVGDAGVRGLLVRRSIGLVAQHDHRDVRRGLDEQLRELQSIRPGRVDLAVDEDDVVRLFRDGLQRALGRRDVLELLGAQERAHGRMASVVGGDGENAHRYAASCPGGSSAVSSQ